MKLKVLNAQVCDPRSLYHQQQVELLLEDGRITTVASSIEQQADAEYDARGSLVAPGFFDPQVFFGDPGLEHRETLETGSRAALHGGFTAVALLPETEPPVDAKANVQSLAAAAADLPVHLYPLAGITRELKGQHLTDMVELAEAGALAFTDGAMADVNSPLLLKALLYVRQFNGIISLLPLDTALTQQGVMNEGRVNTLLGLKGAPAMAEEVAVEKCLALVEYSGTALHLSNISTRRSVELVKMAKEKQLPVTAGVNFHHLLFTEDDLASFNTNLKLQPPLRTHNDQQALLEGLREGTIDIVTSNHRPLEDDLKKCEFNLADYGAIGVQVVLPALLQVLDDPALAVEILAHRNRKTFGLPEVSIQEDQEAQLVFFQPGQEWTFDKTTNKSRSSNSILLGEALKGQPLAIYSKGQLNHLYQ